MFAEVTEKDGAAVIAIKGHIDTLTAREATEIFKKTAEDHDHIILDMSEVSYVSSAGIRALRSLYMLMYKKGGNLNMENVSNEVYSVLEMTGLVDLMNLHSDKKDQ